MKMYKFYWTQEEGMWDEGGHREYDTVIKAKSKREAWVTWFKKMGVWNQLCDEHERDPNTWIPRSNKMDDLFAEALTNEWFYHAIMDIKVELFK